MSTQTENKKIEQIRFEKLSFAYEAGETIFESIDFDFPMNNFVWVRSGQTGAGRSTLLQILSGLISPTKGSYFLNEQDVCEMTFEEFLPYRLSIGYSFDLGGLLHNKTLFENLMLPILYHNRMSEPDAEKLILKYMEDMGIIRFKDQRPSAVVGGVRKMTCLIRPLLLNPQVLLLDEPSLGLGQDKMLKYFDLVNDLRKQGFANHVFVSTFDEKLMSLIEHKEIFIEHGMIHGEGLVEMKKVVHL